MRNGDDDLCQVLGDLIAFSAVLTLDGAVVELKCAVTDGFPASEVVGKKAWDTDWFAFRPESQSQLRDAIARAAQGEAVRYDTIVRVAGGMQLCIDFHIAPIRNDGGGIIHLLAAGIDITPHKEAQKKLRESEEHLRLALHGAVAGAWQWDMRSGVIVWSEENYRLYGLDPAHGPPSHADWTARLHPDDRSHVTRAVKAALRMPEAECRVEFRIVVEPGKVKWLEAIGRVQRTEDGSIVRMCGINVDVTERKRTETLLAEQTALLETLTAKAPIGLAFIDRNYRYVRVNDMLALMNGIAVEAHLGRTPSEVVPDLWPQVEPLYRKALSGEPVVNVELTREKAATGEKRDWLISYYPVRVDASILGVGAVVVDITAQKRTERLLKEADRRKDEFLATLAHELRNPLAPIRNAVQILNLQESPDFTSQAARGIIERQLRQMVRLIDDLMDVSRITRGKLELRREVVLLTTIIEQGIETALPEVERFGHQFTISLPSEMIYLNADAVRLAQVFSNLLNNACKYTRTPGGHIWLTATTQGPDVVVKVKDNGIGIAPENLTHIFDMFAQPSAAHEAPGGGLGIGLSLAKGLVEMHGGRIEARSGGVGQGSEFTVSIPMLARKEMHAERREEEETDHAVGCHRVLVVDDNRDSVESLATLLRLHGQEVAVGYDGNEALHKAREFQPDLILLDIGMPNVNGYDACRMIRDQQWNKAIMMVALTGWGQDEDRRKSKQAGFDAHLVKPVDYGALAALLGSIHRGR